MPAADTDVINAQLEAVRDQMIADLSDEGLSKGNVFVTACSYPVKGFGRMYVQIWDDGGKYVDADGGMKHRHWMMGIAIRNQLVVDQHGKFVAQSRELRRTAEVVGNVVHLFYGPAFTVPPRIAGDGPVAPRMSEPGRIEACIEQRYRMETIWRYQAIKGLE